MKTLRDFNFKGKRALVRADFNVPLDKEGNILDDFRIEKSIPTIEYLVKKKAKLILMSHLDDPGGKVVENLRLTKVQEKLMEYLDLSVVKAPDCIGKEIEKWTFQMKAGEILLLENLRFHKEEKENDEKFAKSLARLGDIYVNDAFASCHRVHASIVGVPKYLPAATGPLLEKEIKALSKIRLNPRRPAIAIFGGTFKEEKDFKFLEKILEFVDFLLIGNLLEKAISEGKYIFRYPEKILAPKRKDSLDLDPESLQIFKEKILKAKTIFWSGPLGKIEENEFQKGTAEIAREIAKSRTFKVAGGGSTVQFLRNFHFASQFDHLSTGGGAMMAFLAGEELPGIEALK